jgi:hypothetical protein
MTPKQLTAFLSRAIPARLPVLITGAPGIGKSDLVAQAASNAKANLILSHPAVADPTDAKGLPWPVPGSDHATFLPFGELYQAMKATEPTVWFLDDLGQASPAVQASFMQLLLARRVNGHALPECVSFVAATNRRTDRAGVTGILEPVKSRFASIVELEPNLDDWCGWAMQANIPHTLIAFLRYKPDLLSDFKPSADLTNCPSPRTWSHVAKLEALNLPASIESTVFGGAVGAGAAVEYMAFRQMAGSLQTAEQIIADPTRAAIPTKPDQLFATSVGLAAKANEKNFGKVVIYAERMYAGRLGEYAALIMRDAMRRSEEKLKNTAAYIDMASGPLGQLLAGEVSHV